LGMLIQKSMELCGYEGEMGDLMLKNIAE